MPPLVAKSDIELAVLRDAMSLFVAVAADNAVKYGNNGDWNAKAKAARALERALRTADSVVIEG